MHLVTPTASTLPSGSKLRWIAWRLPLTILIAPLLYIPGVPWLGHKVYLWVAKNRFNLVPCDDGGCRVRLRAEEGLTTENTENIRVRSKHREQLISCLSALVFPVLCVLWLILSPVFCPDL